MRQGGLVVVTLLTLLVLYAVPRVLVTVSPGLSASTTTTPTPTLQSAVASPPTQILSGALNALGTVVTKGVHAIEATATVARPHPTPIPTRLPSATVPPHRPTAIPTPSPHTPPSLRVRVGTTLYVGNTGGLGVYLHSAPSLATAARLIAVADGTPLIVVGPDTVGDQWTWKHVRTVAGQVAWVPVQFLVRTH